MKKKYFYVCLFGYAGDCAQEVTIVKATSLKHLKTLGFGNNTNTSVHRFKTEDDAEKWALRNNDGYPKHRIKFWG